MRLPAPPRPIWLFILALGCASAFAADYSSPEYSTSGEKLYFKFCAVCHGEKGDAQSRARQSLNPQPRDFTTPRAAEELSRERMIESVTHGRPGTAMVSWQRKLNDQQIAAIVDFIRATFMSHPGAGSKGRKMGDAATAAPNPHEAAAAPADMKLPFPSGLVGDAAKGRAFYMQNCHVCHGDNGDGKGKRADFIKPPPRDFLSADSRHRLNRPTLFNAISIGKRGTVMPAWKTVLSDQEIADVAEFVFETFVHPASGKKKLN